MNSSYGVVRAIAERGDQPLKFTLRSVHPIERESRDWPYAALRNRAALRTV